MLLNNPNLGRNLAMNDSGKTKLLNRLLNLRMAIVEVGIAETNEEAWLRHLTAHPQDFDANIRIFNHNNFAQEQKNLEIKALEEFAEIGK